MKALKTATILSLLLFVSGMLMAATQYGEAVIEQGSMTIVREGRTLSFDELNRPIPVNEEDLIRVRGDSRVILTSREKARMTLGSNAVFHVKPWRARGKSGFVRALFGRFRSVVVGLVGGEEFNVKTATATIGVKGTENFSHVTFNSTTVAGIEHTTYLTGPTGGETGVLEGFLSAQWGINPATLPTELVDELLRVMEDLDSVAPNDPGARVLSVGTILVRRGVITQDELDEAQSDVGEPTTPSEPLIPDLPIDINESVYNLQRARVPLQFQ